MAARVKLLPPAALLAALDRRLRCCADGPRDLPARHQTLRPRCRGSYELLNHDARHCFGGWACLSAAGRLTAGCRANCGERARAAAHQPELARNSQFIAALVEHSLVLPRPPVGCAAALQHARNDPRVCARADWRSAARRSAVQQAHAAYFLALARASRSAELHGPHQVTLARPAGGRSTPIYGRRSSGCYRTGDLEQALRLAGALWLVLACARL